MDHVNRPPWVIAKFEEDYMKGELLLNKSEPRSLPIYPLSYPLDELLMVNILPRKEGVELHAFAVVQENQEQGLIFTGMSGAGKSTLTRLWQKRPGATILSDDRVILRKMAGGYKIYGTPWHGDAIGVSNKSASIDKIFILKQALHNGVTQLNPAVAAAKLMARCFPTFWDAEGMSATLKIITELSQTVPCYEFEFLPDQSAIDFILNQPDLS